MPWYVYLSFTQNFYMGARHTYNLFLAPSWSLAVEEQFYLTIPILVRFLPRRWIGGTIAFLMFASISTRSFLALTDKINNVQMFTLPFCRADALLIGVACALLVRNHRFCHFCGQLPILLHFVAGLFGLSLLCFGVGHWTDPGLRIQTIGLTLWPLFFASIVLIGVLHPGSPLCKLFRFKPLVALGSIAFGLYLIHQLVLSVALALFELNSAPSLRLAWLSVACSLVISIGIASMSWIFVEKRFVKLGRRSSYQAKTTDAILVAR